MRNFFLQFIPELRNIFQPQSAALLVGIWIHLHVVYHSAFALTVAHPLILAGCKLEMSC